MATEQQNTYCKVRDLFICKCGIANCSAIDNAWQCTTVVLRANAALDYNPEWSVKACPAVHGR